MSIKIMPVHKFINKANNCLTWIVKDNKYPAIQHQNKWEIFAQENISIQPGHIFTANLGLGIMNNTSCLVSLRQTLKERRCSLLDSVISEDVDDIIVNIQNNSSSTVEINEGDSLCYVS